MKKTLNILLAGLALTICFASCSKESLEEQQARAEAAAQEKADAFWDVVGQLVSGEFIGSEYEGQTFEPVIGIEDPSDPQTRIVPTNALESARERYADLVGKEVSEISSGYTYTLENAGTLSYSEGGSNSLATVEVNIKQLPHLTKIRYATPEQIGENGSFEGAAYYRFGDVISIETSDHRTEYWICVRPAFGKEGKENTHWVTVSPVGKDNALNYPSTSASNKKEYNIQTDLKYEKKHLQNFAEMLYAICYPAKWHDNVTDIPKLKMFNDFDKENIRYHNEHFWENVQNAWERLGVSEKVFGQPLGFFTDKMGSSTGLYFLYGKSTWHYRISNTVTVNQVRFTNTAGGVGANMHTVKYTSPNHDVINKKDHSKDIEYNVLTECTLAKPYLLKPAFFENDNPNEPRFIVRVAEGCELSATGKYGDNDVRSPIPGAKDVYRYYKDVNPTDDLANSDLFPEVTTDASEVKNALTDGSGTYMIGDVVEDEKGNRWICILGSPWSQITSSLTSNHTATFVSFDFKDVDTSGDKVQGLPNEDGAIKLATSFLCMIMESRNWSGNYQFVPGTVANSLGSVFQHILDYTGIDLSKAATVVDSTWTFTGWNLERTSSKQYNSRSGPTILNFAYDDGTQGKQAIIRAIIDNTQAGSARTSCRAKSGTKYEDAYFRLYKHYETFDTSRMRSMTEDEKSLGMTEYCLPWAMTQEKMYLQDVANQSMVDLHAKDDKWVRLPLNTGANQPVGARRSPRTRAESSAKPVDYIGHYSGNAAIKTNIFNEPVIFARVMYVEDNGGKKPNLVSKDGRKLKVVHMQDDGTLYRGSKQASWALQYSVAGPSFYTLDNVKFTAPSLP